MEICLSSLGVTFVFFPREILKSHHLTHLKTTLKALENTVQGRNHSQHEDEHDFLIRLFQHFRSFLQFYECLSIFQVISPHSAIWKPDTKMPFLLLSTQWAHGEISRGWSPLGDPGIFVHFQTMASLLTEQGKYSCIDFVENYNLVLTAAGHSDLERPMSVFLLHHRVREKIFWKKDQGWGGTTEVENPGGDLDSILLCFIVNLLLWLQDQVICGIR